MASEFDRIYDMMSGNVPPKNGMENVYCGPCGALREQAEAARKRLESLAEKTADPQMALWVRAVVDAYTRMQRLMCIEAYQYGQEAGREEMRQALQREGEAKAAQARKA